MEILPVSVVSNYSSHVGAVVPMQILAPSIFSRELRRCEDKRRTVIKMDLQELGDLLESAGEALEEFPSLANFQTFRELIGRFAQLATSAAYQVASISAGGGQGNLEYVAVINREADMLYHLVMQSQNNRVTIASRLASIKGMIFKIVV